MVAGVEELLQELGGIKSFAQGLVAQEREATQEEMGKLAKGLEDIQAGMAQIRKERIGRMGDDGRLMVREGRFLGHDPMSLKMCEAIIQSTHLGRGIAWDESNKWRKDLIDARTQIRDGFSAEQAFGWEERAISERGAAFGFAKNPGSAKFAAEAAHWRTQLVDLAAKAMDSTTAGSGDELVPTLEAAQLWMDVNLDTVVLPLLQQTPMMSNPYQMPLQLGATNWYPTTENIQTQVSNLTTARTTLTAFGLKTGVPFSDELTEDAIIALVPELRRSLSRDAAEVIDDVLLNGDTTVTNGINSDGATISSATAGKAHWLLGFDGLIHLPLVDNTSQGFDLNAAPTAAAYNRVLVKMGKYAAPSRRGDVAFITDVTTAIKSLAIDEFETVDTAGARATLSSGEILNAYGKPLVHTAQIRAADTDGKVTDSGNSEENGRILGVNTTQWRVGFRRQITMETEREAGKGQTTLYLSFRIALAERTGARSTATHTALAYNITNDV